MRYIEYLYLVFAIGLTGFMAVNFSELPTGNKLLFGLAIALCAFMFSFRRKQRQIMDQHERERIEKLEEEAEADDNE